MEEPAAKQPKIDTTDEAEVSTSGQSLEPSDYQSLLKVNDLGDENLKQVFTWLSLTEKFGIERVCKKWREAVDSIFKSNQSELILVGSDRTTSFFEMLNWIHLSANALVEDEQDPEQFSSFALDNIALAVRVMQEVKSVNVVFIPTNPKTDSHLFAVWLFSRLPSIKTLSLRAIEPLTATLLRNSFQHLLSLKALTISDSVLEASGWDQLKGVCKNLTSLVFQINRLPNDNIAEITSIFQDARTLAKLDVMQYTWKQQGYFLTYLPTSLEDLAFNALNIAQIEEVIIGLANLKSLTARISSYTLDQNVLFSEQLDIFARIPNLKSLSIENGTFCTFIFDTMESLSNISKLSLSNIVFTKANFVQLCEKLVSVSDLKLKYYIMCGCEKGEGDVVAGGQEDSDDDFVAEYNDCDGCLKTFLQPLATLSKLKKLSLETENISRDESLPTILKSQLLPELRSLSLSQLSDDLTDAFFEFASEQPRKAFVLYTGKDDISTGETKFASLPRNITIINPI